MLPLYSTHHGENGTVTFISIRIFWQKNGTDIIFVMEGKVIVFDVETTGIDVETDQIIEIAVKQGLEEGVPPKVLRIKPSIPISKEAQAVHGIGMEDLRDCKSFSHYAQELQGMFDEAEVIIGYNVNFDLSVLQAELQRNGFAPFNETGKLLVDPKRIWQEMEPRKLSDAYRRFAGAEMPDAHSASGDVLGVVRVLRGMLREFGLENRTWAELSQISNLRRKNWFGGTYHLHLRQGKVILGFGKHKWKELSKIVEEDPGYLEWVASKSDLPQHVKDACKQALENRE